MTMDNENRELQVKCLQQNLSAIRKIAGWTAEQLGDKIGVTKQTISNLENSKTPMSVTQYIAIRSVLDYEMQTSKENTVLPQVVSILLDKRAELGEEDYNKVREAMATISAAAAGGVTGAVLASVFSTVLASLVIGGAAAVNPIAAFASGAVAGTAAWLKKILKK